MTSLTLGRLRIDPTDDRHVATSRLLERAVAALADRGEELRRWEVAHPCAAIVERAARGEPVELTATRRGL